MKAKRIITLVLAGALSAATVVSASAATLTNEAPSADTEVTARIEGSDPGDVTYIITIPDKVDFGTLNQPDTDTDSYIYSGFEVEATQIDMASGAVSVYIQGYEEDDNQYYLTQLDAFEPFEIPYDVYTGQISDTNIADQTAINADGSPGVNGYHFTTFNHDAEGSVQDGTLVLNQRELYGQDLDTISGDYSDTMTFYSTIISLP